MTTSVQTKVCTKCKQARSLSQFNKDNSRSDGLQPWCKSCKGAKRSAERAANRLAVQRYRQEHKEEIKQRRNRKREAELSAAKRRDLKTWPLMAIHGIRSRARKENRECSILPEDIVVPDFCPVLGIPLMAGSEAPLDNRPSVDRFDNSRGYIKDNIRVISYRANQLKRDATVDEVRRILHYMEGG